jgi:hypothetical protein
MNNQDKVTELQRIISTAQDDLAKLMKKGKRFKPEWNEEFYFVNGSVDAEKTFNCNLIEDKERYEHFNCYETEELATKASPMMRRNNAIIMACLMVDPDFVPDYLSGNQEHWGFEYINPSMGHDGEWGPHSHFSDNRGPCVSTYDKWEEAAALLTEWESE